MLIKHIDLVERRLVNEETIAHEEKVFSLFEPHTELIKKGKTMPPVEFGHRFLVSTDQFQLVVDYKVMEGGSEGAEIIPVADRLLNRFGEGSLAYLGPWLTNRVESGSRAAAPPERIRAGSARLQTRSRPRSHSLWLPSYGFPLVVRL